MLDAVRVALIGPTTRTVSLSQTASGFEGTITGLEPGTYSLLVQGLETGLVEFLGAASGINVVAGETADAVVSVFGFVTTLDPVSNVDDVSLTFDVTFTDVGVATEYLIEVSPDRDFPTDNILSFPTTQTSVTVSVPWPGVYFVRVRAGNDVVSPDEALPSDRRIVRLFNDFLTFGQVDARTDFLTVPDQVDAYGFNVQVGDGVVAMAFSPEGLSPSSPLSRLGEVGAGAALYSGAATVTNKEERKAAATLARQALLDLDMRLRPKFDADGLNPTLIGGNNNIGGRTFLSLNGDEMVVTLANTSGVRTVELRPASGTGEYTVSVSKCDVFPISVGQTFDGSLADTDCITVNPEAVVLTYADLVTFDGFMGDQVGIALASGSFDPVLLVFGPDGTLVAANDDFDGFNSRIPALPLPMDGTYVAVATAYDEFTTGPYSLTISDASPGVPSQVLFSLLPPASVTVRTPFSTPVVVEVLDSDDILVPTAAVDVTLQLVDNPGSLIFRASGAGVDGRMELVDPVTLDVLPPVTTGHPSIIVSMTYDATSDRVLAADEDWELLSIDPQTGVQTSIGQIVDPFSSLVFMKGLAFEQPGGRLLGADAFSDVIYEIDPATGDATDIGTVIAASPIDGFNGLAVDPTDGTLYAVTRFDAANRQVRNLITIDLGTFNATDLGQLAEDGVAGIAFDPNGTLYAVTGDGATNPEKLWTVDKTDATLMNFETGLGGTGGGGEAIASVPGQLTGTTKLTTVAGIAFFTDLEINATGVGYTIAVTSPGLIGVISTPVDVNP
jgi:hypothetical protein